MKLRHSVSMALVASSMVVAGVALAAQDKWALKAPTDLVRGIQGLRVVADDRLERPR